MNMQTLHFCSEIVYHVIAGHIDVGSEEQLGSFGSWVDLPQRLRSLFILRFLKNGHYWSCTSGSVLNATVPPTSETAKYVAMSAKANGLNLFICMRGADLSRRSVGHGPVIDRYRQRRVALTHSFIKYMLSPSFVPTMGTICPLQTVALEGPLGVWHLCDCGALPWSMALVCVEEGLDTVCSTSVTPDPRCCCR